MLKTGESEPKALCVSVGSPAAADDVISERLDVGVTGAPEAVSHVMGLIAKTLPNMARKGVGLSGPERRVPWICGISSVPFFVRAELPSGTAQSGSDRFVIDVSGSAEDVRRVFPRLIDAAHRLVAREVVLETRRHNFCLVLRTNGWNQTEVAIRSPRGYVASTGYAPYIAAMADRICATVDDFRLPDSGPAIAESAAPPLSVVAREETAEALVA